MYLIEFLLRRIINNKWLFISLIIGSVSTCAIFSSIPMYSNAILQKVLMKDLNNYNVTNGSYVTELKVKYNNLYKPKNEQKNELIKLEKIINNEILPAYDLPEKSKVKTVRYTRLVLKSLKNSGISNDSLASMLSLSDINKHINILAGRVPENDSGKGVYEVIVSEEAIKKLDLVLDDIYDIYLPDFLSDNQKLVMKVKIVGVFSVREDNDLYWSKDRLAEISDAIIIDENVSSILYDSDDISFNKIEWDCIFDYTKIRVQNVRNIIDTHDSQLRWNQRNKNIVNINTPLKNVLEDYQNREKQLRITMGMLFIPLLILLGLYSHLISDIIVKNESNEIAILKSRGASTIQVFINYVIQSLFVFVIANLLGIIVALFLCQVLGSANGFLEFVNREALDLDINFEVILYSIVGGIISIIFMLIPALNASKMSIIQYKKSIVKSNTTPLWQRLYLDIILICVSAYGFYRYKSNQQILSTTGLNITIDPLLYFLATFFILGISLLLLRIYPLIIELIFRAGKRFWSAVWYLVLVNVSRKEKNSQIIMLFLILSLAFGIMNANQARTINTNMEDRIMYTNGADVVVNQYNSIKHNDENRSSNIIANQLSNANMTRNNTDSQGAKPLYEELSDIKGIERMTKVFANDNLNLSFGSEEVSDLRVMGINPYEFGIISWSRSRLLPYHINTYLNTLTKSPESVFLSSDINKNFNIKVGDTVKVKINNYELPVVVSGFIDYFPSCALYTKDGIDGKVSSKMRSFAILNYEYIEKRIPSISYEIWMKKNINTSDNEIYNELKSKKLEYDKINFTNIDIIQQKNDPVLQGTNGVLTMCFIITMLISFLGYMIFWILSLKDKALKFGLSRAIGMPMKGITMIITLEQLLVSGFAIAIGIFIGSISSSIFIPMLIMSYSSAVQVPPFRVIALKSDYIRLIIITLTMIVSAIAILNVLIKKIKVHMILKLGEDR